MSKTDEQSNSAESAPQSSPTTDFAKYSRRRFTDLPLPDGGTFRVQSLKRSEMLPKLKMLPPERHFDALITLAVIDERNDTLWACSEESFAALDDMDYQIYEALLEGVRAFCTNPIDYEQLKKSLLAT